MSSDDLLQTQVASKTEWATVTKQYDGDASDNDAQINLTDQNTYPMDPALGGIYTYHLDVTTNPSGYDVTRVDMASGRYSDRAHQGYVFYVSADGGSSFTEIASVGRWGGEDLDFPVDSHDPSTQYAKTSIFDDTGSALATGVDTIRIGITDTHTTWLEWDVMGETATPPPAGTVLIVR